MIFSLIIFAIFFLLGVVIFALNCMVESMTPNDKQQEKLRRMIGCHKWFAWHPVKIHCCNSMGKYVCLKTVYRDFEIIEVYGRLSANPEGPKYYLIGGEK